MIDRKTKIISAQPEKVKRQDIKVGPDLKFDLQIEATRLGVFDYEITEEALRRFLRRTARLPKQAGSQAIRNIGAGNEAVRDVPEQHRELVKGILDFIEYPPAQPSPDQKRVRQILLASLYHMAGMEPPE